MLVDNIPEDPELRRAWNALALRMEQPEVFYTYEWAVAVQRAYSASLKPLVVLGYENGSVVGVAALAKKNSGAVVFLTADTGDYCDFLSDPSRRAAFAHAVFAKLSSAEVKKIILTNLPADSATASVLEAAAGSGYHLHSRPAYDCAQVIMGSAEDREELKQTVLAKKRLRRNIREFQKRGDVRLQHDTEWNIIEPLLRPFSEAHAARFLETGKVSSLVREERRVFIAELARALSETGWIAFSRFMVGDATAAWNYGFRFAGSWFWYQPTVNGRYWDFSPGYCLLAKIVEQACDLPEFKLVDLGLGAEGYKGRFATASRRTLYCELNRSLGSHLYSVARYRAASAATASPRFEKYIRSVLSRIAHLKERLREGSWKGLLTSFLRRAIRALYFVDDVFFFEWPADVPARKASSTRLRPLEPEDLGAAAIEYGDDPAALRFLMRSANRLLSEKALGFVLVTAEGVPVHFCWAKDFEGFYMAELDRTLHAPSQNAMMIFDCFTPVRVRGHGFFSEAISIVAEQLKSQGQMPWIFGAATNQSSVQGIKKTPFTYRFSLGRRHIFFFEQEKDSVPVTANAERPVSVS